MKRMAVSIVLIAIIFFATAPAIAKQDFKPSKAEDVELVKKITAESPKGKGSDKTKQVSTGVLGNTCGLGCEKYAIVIGISDYPGTGNDLRYADDDALDVYNTLVTVYGFSPSNIYLLIDMNANLDNIVSAINYIKSKADENDEVFFFFSGHGARGIAEDGDKEKIDESIVVHDGLNLVYLWDGDLKALFSGFNTQRIIFAFDSCLAGGMTDLNANGRIVVMATTENGLSYEGDTWNNGQFTYYFFERGMLFGQAEKYDHDKNPETRDVTVEEAFDYAKANCSQQTPTIGDLFNNDLLM